MKKTGERGAAEVELAITLRFGLAVHVPADDIGGNNSFGRLAKIPKLVN